MMTSARGVMVALSHGPLAQLAEQLTLNQRVRGSSPRGLTSFAPVQPLLPVSPGFPGDRQYGLSWFSRPILPLLLPIETR